MCFKLHRQSLYFVVGLLGWSGLSDAQTAPVFDTKFAPVQEIFKKSCVGCHNEQSHASGLALDSWSAVQAGGAQHRLVVIPGDPEKSALLKFIDGRLSPRMPYGQAPLSEKEIATVREWIKNLPVEQTETKKKQPSWWAFQSLKKTAGESADIDSLIQEKLHARNLTPAPEASKFILLRRVYADLIGIPPTFAEAQQFIADSSPRAYENLVDRLLSDRRFGERWGRHWLDLVRFADTQGFEANRENYYMWRYRDYVINAFNQDKPYDLFIREQLAGDEIPQASSDAKIAAGFLRLAPRFQTTNALEARQMALDELTGTISSVFLGLTVRCAQCHDHKYDPISQKDFYRMQAFLGPLEMVETPVEFSDPEWKTHADLVRTEIQKKIQSKRSELEAYQGSLLNKLSLPTALGDQFSGAADLGNVFARKTTKEIQTLENHLTESIANGIVPNVADAKFTLEEKQKYIDYLIDIDGTRGGRDMGTFQREIRRYAPYAHTVRNVVADASRPMLPVTFVRINGAFDQPGDWVEPGFLSAITGNAEPADLGKDQFGNSRLWRTPLANWIASPENPVTARVMVNRIWQHFFGNGIVTTASDFGRNGARPTHPELLDLLAGKFIEDRWSIKKTIRRIVTSSTYRQSSAVASETGNEVDPSNKLLWRQNRRRLEGEVVRDGVLLTSGRLVDDQGGPGSFVPLPSEMKERMTIKNQPSWTPTNGPESRKRSVYIFQRRQLEVPYLSVMDVQVFQASCERRSESITAVQALTLMNDQFVSEQAGYLAEQIRKEIGPDSKEQAETLFHRILSRDPTLKELNAVNEFIRLNPKTNLAEAGRVLFNTNEFVYVD